MRTQDLFNQTWRSVSHNKARTGLTILGIVIGIASVIVMLSIGQGAQSTVEETINSIGTDILTISSGSSYSNGISQGAGSADTLTESDVDGLHSYLNFVEAVEPISSERVTAVISGGTNTSVSAYGVEPSYFLVKDFELQQGSTFTDSDVDDLSRKAVLGYSAYEDLYEASGFVVGDTVTLNDVDFRIIGVFEELGSSSDDSLIYTPISTVQHYLSGSSSLSSILVKVGNDDDVILVENIIEQVMRSLHHLDEDDEDDFSVSDPTSFLETASSVTEIFTILLASVAGISLVVGGIGIMNMMLTTVSERTKEIGIRKSLGATEFNITLQFLTEAVSLTLLGGTLGLAIGYGISKIISAAGLIDTVVSLNSVLLAVGVSSAIGVLFGYYPSKRAARLDPIEALRYE